MKFPFSIQQIDFVGLEARSNWALPSDLLQVLEPKGDRFRDDFTRSCLYLSRRSHLNKEGSADPAATSVVVATEYGNLAAMMRFHLQVRADDGTASAQQFPHSTMSSASTFVNLDQKLTGGNITVNAGSLNPVVALLHTCLQQNLRNLTTTHVLIGDVYCAEALEDVQKNKNPEMTATSGVLYLGIQKGNRFSAQFEFFEKSDRSLHLLRDYFKPDHNLETHYFLDHEAADFLGPHLAADLTTQKRVHIEKDWNRAVLAKDFFKSLPQLVATQSSVLVLSYGSRLASVKVASFEDMPKGLV